MKALSFDVDLRGVILTLTLAGPGIAQGDSEMLAPATRVTFGGVVSLVDGDDGLLAELGLSPALGDPFDFSLDIVFLTPDALPAVPETGTYPGALLRAELGLFGSVPGSVNWAAANANSAMIVANDSGVTTLLDRWFADARNPTPASPADLRLSGQVVLQNASTLAPVPPLTSDALIDPSSVPLSSWATSASQEPPVWFQMLVSAERTNPLTGQTGVFFDRIEGTFVRVDSVPVVPVPAAAWLFGPALAILALFQRARKGETPP